MITAPDLLLVADATLLEDASAGVLLGAECASALLLNCAASADDLARRYVLPCPAQTCDLSAFTEQELGKAHNLSAALGAAACGMMGLVSEAVLEQAVREELASLELPPEAIEKNLRIARQVFESIRPVSLRQDRSSPPLVAIWRPRLVSGARGVPILCDPGNSAARHTGSWRTARPVIDRAACTRCLVCVVRCPEGGITLDSTGYPVIDQDNCKGCMICVQECPLRCIAEQKEVPSWEPR